MAYQSVIFREYDIRGVYNEQFDDNFALLLGKALVTYINQRKSDKNPPNITLGFDARHSSPRLIQSLAEGIVSSGGNVQHLGLVTTPISYFSTFVLPQIDGAIMVTGSHNPPEYNGFKISVGKSTIFGEEIKKLETIIENKAFGNGNGSETHVDIFDRYISRYSEEFGKLEQIPIVLDCGNGAAGCIARRLYESVGLKPDILFENPDGDFPNHHPDPTVEKNLKDLSARVLKNKAVVGIGFDGDADRIGVVDENGDMVYGDELIALWARFVLPDSNIKKIIGDVKCSDRLYNYITKYNGEPIMWKTGHSLIKEKIKVEKSPFGGELSGHVFFADRNYGYDDALYAGLRLCEIIAKTKKGIRELLSDFPKAHSTPEIRIDTTEEKKTSIVSALKSNFSDRRDLKINLIDGIRISYPDGWALARASNTQPVLVLRFESSSEKGLERIREEIEAVVNPLL